MNEPLRTYYLSGCPICDDYKERGTAFCAACTRLVDPDTWYKLRQPRSAVDYDKAWFKAADEIRKARTHAAVYQ